MALPLFTQSLGVYLEHPVFGAHKYIDLLLQVGGWANGWHLPLKHHMPRNLENRRPRPNTVLLHYAPSYHH